MAEQKIFYISDTHFGDKANLRYDNLASDDIFFSSVDERATAIIENWKAAVGTKDKVYILGDVFAMSEHKAREVLKQLPGQKYFILGNHDRAWLTKIAESGKYNTHGIKPYDEITDNGRKVVISHYPIMFWNGQHSGTYHVYGHVHNSVEEDFFQHFGTELVENGTFPEFRAINAGAMVNGYRPMTLDEMLERADLHGDISDFTRCDQAKREEYGQAAKTAECSICGCDTAFVPNADANGRYYFCTKCAKRLEL